MPICKYCKKEISKDNAYSVQKGIYYCNEEHYLSAIAKKNNTSKHSYKSIEGSDRRHFTDMVQDMYIRYGWDKRKINWQVICSQANTLLKNNPNWNYATIEYILWYEEEILGLQMITKESNWSPLSLVDYHALDAQLYWEECEKVIESTKNYRSDDNIVIKATTQEYRPKYKMIDMGEL